ncbi:MAG: hypothetical protein HRF51_04780 [bacterium]|jgi:hypothetical protein
MARTLLFLFTIFSLLVGIIRAQTSLNPDLSVVGDIRLFSHNDSLRLKESEEFNLSTPEMEMVIAGYLNPYARADAVIGWHEGADAEVEEFYATMLRGLPLGINLRVGKYLLQFGRLNPVHPHAYTFIYRPLPHTEFFGDEGLRDMAVRISFLLPTGKIYTELMGSVLKGDLFEVHEPEADTTYEEEIGEKVNPGFFGRLTVSIPVSEYSELALGSSFATGIYDSHENLRAYLGGVDMKFKWKPDRNRSLTIEAEGLLSHRRKEDRNAVDAYGGYGYIDFRLRQKYNLGGIFEYAQNKLESDSDTWRVGGFLGFSPIEETSLLRFVGNWTKPSDRDGYWSLTLQLVFSLGPHQPHNF